jgi:hypothetical protein
VKDDRVWEVQAEKNEEIQCVHVGAYPIQGTSGPHRKPKQCAQWSAEKRRVSCRIGDSLGRGSGRARQSKAKQGTH